MGTTQKQLDLAVLAGEILLKNGAEIARTQQTMQYILRAFSLKTFDVYVLANGIFATVTQPDGTRVAAVREVPLGDIHLGRVAAVNTISRQIAAQKGHCNLEHTMQALHRCAEMPPKPFWLQLLACGVGAAGFCFLLGGSAGDCISAFIAGIVLQGILCAAGRRQNSMYIPTIVCAAIVTALCAGLHGIGLGQSLTLMVTGSITPLVPGIALTTSIRDFFQGDYLSGSIHLINALMRAACIATGVVAALQLLAFVGLGGTL